MNVVKTDFQLKQRRLKDERTRNSWNNYIVFNSQTKFPGVMKSPKPEPNRIRIRQTGRIEHCVTKSFSRTHFDGFEDKSFDGSSLYASVISGSRCQSQPNSRPSNEFVNNSSEPLRTSKSSVHSALRPNTRNGTFSSGMKTPNTKRIGKSPKMSCSGKLKKSESGGYILAVTEGRGQARGEVGIAGMDPKRPLLVLCQISDGQRYLNSLTKMNVFEIVEVIVPNTFVDGGYPNKLYRDIRMRFPRAAITSIQRRHFNETIGIDLIKQYCSSESISIMLLLRDKFYALSAAAALIRYIEFTQNVHLAPNSLKIEYQGSEDTMLIDLDTANHLELVMCISHPETNAGNSLLGVVNHCHTRGGIRLLRANILQPYFCLSKIENRLHCIEELIKNPILFCKLEACVTNFVNVENLLNLCMHVPQQEGIRAAECQLKYTLLLKTTLEFLPKLISSLENARSDYFHQILQNLRDPRFDMILSKILETVLENVKVVKGSVAAHLHGCFAIKTGVNSLLDVAKKTYCEIVQEIMDHVTKLREKHNLPLRTAFSASKGFHIQCSLTCDRRLLKLKDLPKEFILVQKSKAGFTSYTTDLVALDQRSKHVLDEIKLMTNAILFELLTDIRQNIGCLFNLCEIIAELDVLVSFAHVSSGKSYSKPNFGGDLHLKMSRHPILDSAQIDGDTVPNDVFAKNDQNFTILTGPNQSGKSIYIRQIALLQIMAQIGCFVPAEEANFKLMNRIFSRISFDDSIESNACTLMVEMRDVEYIRRNVNSHSLVIIDELCRGTSVEEGTNLAFAISEQLLDTSAFIFFTTHYLFLTKLEEMYSNVINCHFESKLEVLECGKVLTRFTHSLMQGPTTAESYGLRVAELTSFPAHAWSVATEISRRLRESRKLLAEIHGLPSRFKLSLLLKRELSKADGEIDCNAIKPVVRKFRKRYLKLLSGTSQVLTESGETKNVALPHTTHDMNPLLAGCMDLMPI